MKTGFSHRSIDASSTATIKQHGNQALLKVGAHSYIFAGKWIKGGPWERFGFYNAYVVVREDGLVMKMPAHAGELTPGATEDLVDFLPLYDPESRRPPVPFSLELDPTYVCASKDCGGHCFSAPYRRLNPRLTIPTGVLESVIQTFAGHGGRIVRFDGGGDPMTHPDVRNGKLPMLAHRLKLKSTILTAGDNLSASKLEVIGDADCYLRVSLNAATDRTRRLFHGNRSSITKIFVTLSRFASWLKINNPQLPIGATYLLSDQNFDEVYACALRAKESGVNHFSVRRVLGGDALRPRFSEAQMAEVSDVFEQIRALADSNFRVFLPWRNLNEPDINPASLAFETAACWQSTFKAILEPSTEAKFKVQLCGRYRGDGVGQAMQLPPLFCDSDGARWVERWRDSFINYPLSRSALPYTCVSCIDRGFIKMMDNLLAFLDPPNFRFKIFHLFLEE